MPRRLPVKRLLKQRPETLLLVLAILVVSYGWQVLMPPQSEASWKELPSGPCALFADELPAPGERTPVPRPGRTARFLMYNVQNYFVPEDPRRSTWHMTYKRNDKREAVADVIASVKPDIVGLVEIGGRKALDDLAERLEKRGLHYPVRVVVERGGEDRALGLLSRIPLERNDSRAEYPLYGDHRRTMLRGILDVTLRTEDGRPFRIVGVHLKSHVGDDPAAAESLRRREGETLARYLLTIQRRSPGLPLLVFGDMNDSASSPAVQSFSRGLASDSALTRLRPADRTGAGWTLYYRAEDSYITFDHIFVNGTLKERIDATATGVVDLPEGRKASDHRAIWCELR